MTSPTESFRIAFRVSDKQFVVRDNSDNNVFAGNYREVESWLDQHENTVAALREQEHQVDSETDAAAAVLKATMLTQEMLDKALAPDPESEPESERESNPEPQTKSASLRTRLFGKKEEAK
jgi:hypothetical protein